MASLWTLSACGGHKQARVNPPPPPAISPPATETSKVPAADSTPSPPSSKSRTAKSVAKPRVENDKAESNPEADIAVTPSADLAEPQVPEGTTVLSTETGLASWYGPPFHNRRGSNGEVYNMHAMTAAHRTLPLGSIVRVTNTKNGLSALVRITDRGPFIPGRVIDLSLAAAQKIELWRAGVAPVKLEVLETPAPLDAGGKWAVQIGGFPDQDEAATLAGHLTRRYRSAKVLSFASPAGDWWIRVRVLDDDHARAQQLASETKTSEGAVFLVRLD